MTVDVLGTKYRIETHKISEDEFMQKNHLEGWCGEDSKIIAIADYSEEEYFPDMTEGERKTRRNRDLRHEIYHAFLNESGLSTSAQPYYGAWTKNEEMIDWNAIQLPKIFAAYKECGCLD